MAEARMQGHLPVELVGNDPGPRIRIPGYPHLTFEGTDSYLDKEGVPRRLEWFPQDEMVQTFLNTYNRPGRDKVFVLATDLINKQTAESYDVALTAGLMRLDVLKRLEDLEAICDYLEGGKLLKDIVEGESTDEAPKMETAEEEVTEEAPPADDPEEEAVEEEVKKAPRGRPRGRKKATEG